MIAERSYAHDELLAMAADLESYPDSRLARAADMLRGHVEKVQALEADRDCWKQAWSALFETLRAMRGAAPGLTCEKFHNGERCLLQAPHEGMWHVNVNGQQWK